MDGYAYVHRDGAEHVEVLTGDVITVATLAEIPGDSLALIPYRQITERGFDCVDDHAPLECLRIRSRTTTRIAPAPDEPPAISGGRFDIPDDEYAAIVGDILEHEIGRGEGANFVIHRTYEATVDGDVEAAAHNAFRRLLEGERGAYWTFLVNTGTRILVGASPERHVSVDDGLTMMNPISGTLRHGSEKTLLEFLRDPKEVEELYMVLDEELKMMAAVAEHGGQVIGPYLKQMTHLTHTEYLLAGRGNLDVRDVLRATMFAPTVTGSPIENACRVIARHEKRGRGYYAGVLALLGHDDQGRETLDAPILIRTAEFTNDNRLRVPVGATLVRHSTAAGEVAETHTKAAGVLAALGVRPATRPVTPPKIDTPAVAEALAARNTDLARFWLDERAPGSAILQGRSALIVDAEDTFTAMLAHQLRSLGLNVTVCAYPKMGLLEADLVIAGPGPGDPASATDPKMAYLRGLLTGLLAAGRPVLGVCLGHQVMSGLLGLPLHRRDQPYQGVAKEIDLWGTRRRVGFYSSFTALSAQDRLETPHGVVEIARDQADGSVHALRGPAFAGVQFHPESVLSRDGMAILAEVLPALLISPVHTG